MKGLITAAILFLGVFTSNMEAQAKAPLTKAKADALVTDYLMSTAIKSTSLLKHDGIDECEPRDRVSCTEVVCSYGHCNFSSDMQEVSQACRGSDGACVEAICKRGRCSFKSDTIEVVQSCKRANGECVEIGCEHGHCGFQSDAKDIAKACMGVRDEGCIRMACDRGHCSFKSDFVKMARSCAGF